MSPTTVTPKAAPTRVRSVFAGKWTYRSYRSLPDITVGDDAQKALSLLFGEGVMTIADGDPKAIKGSFDMGGGYVLDLRGSIKPAAGAAPAIMQVRGIGRPSTLTDHWEYDYQGYLAWTWPEGVGQVPAIVGTVLRAKPHGTAKAGVVASFIATKQS